VIEGPKTITLNTLAAEKATDLADTPDKDHIDHLMRTEIRGIQIGETGNHHDASGIPEEKTSIHTYRLLVPGLVKIVRHLAIAQDLVRRRHETAVTSSLNTRDLLLDDTLHAEMKDHGHP
jgi:hypothetical protein